tara:strand:- start:163 stop:489 length:327 start_codon:yes stop_codon:yes gene_type:complete
MSNHIKNICLIFFALFAPIYLPSGGIQKDLNNFSSHNNAKEITLNSNHSIYIMPDLYSKKLRHLKTGSTLFILRHWITSNDDRWFRVQISNNIFADNLNKPLRGWIKV